MGGPHTAPTRHELRLPGAQSGELSNTTRPCLVSVPRLMRKEIRVGGSTTSSSTTLMCHVNSHKYETLREQTSIYSLPSKILPPSKNTCHQNGQKGMYLELKYIYIHLLLSIWMTSSTSYPKVLYIQQTQNIRSTVGNY